MAHIHTLSLSHTHTHTLTHSHTYLLSLVHAVDMESWITTWNKIRFQFGPFCELVNRSRSQELVSAYGNTDVGGIITQMLDTKLQKTKKKVNTDFSQSTKHTKLINCQVMLE